jgi:hypothetical protein
MIQPIPLEFDLGSLFKLTALLLPSFLFHSRILGTYLKPMTILISYFHFVLIILFISKQDLLFEFLILLFAFLKIPCILFINLNVKFYCFMTILALLLLCLLSMFNLTFLRDNPSY